MSEITKHKLDDFGPNFNKHQFYALIQRNTIITTNLNGIRINGKIDGNDDIIFVFASTLSPTELTELDTLISNYTFESRKQNDLTVYDVIDPVSTNDEYERFEAGTTWINKITGDTFILINNTANNANWKKVNLYGSEQQAVDSLEEVCSSSTNLQTKLDYDVNVPAGSYKLEWTYCWTTSLNGQSKQFNARVIVDNDDENPIHQHTAVATYPNTFEHFSNYACVALTAGSHNFKIKFYRSGDVTTAKIKNVHFTLYRIN